MSLILNQKQFPIPLMRMHAGRISWQSLHIVIALEKPQNKFLLYMVGNMYNKLRRVDTCTFLLSLFILLIYIIRDLTGIL